MSLEPSPSASPDPSIGDRLAAALVAGAPDGELSALVDEGLACSAWCSGCPDAAWLLLEAISRLDQPAEAIHAFSRQFQLPASSEAGPGMTASACRHSLGCVRRLRAMLGALALYKTQLGLSRVAATVLHVVRFPACELSDAWHWLCIAFRGHETLAADVLTACCKGLCRQCMPSRRIDYLASLAGLVLVGGGPVPGLDLALAALDGGVKEAGARCIELFDVMVATLRLLEAARSNRPCSDLADALIGALVGLGVKAEIERKSRPNPSPAPGLAAAVLAWASAVLDTIDWTETSSDGSQ